jgi:putative oxidoreductase
MTQNKPLGPAALQGNTGFAISLALLLIRLVLGWVFIYHGGQKVFGWFTADGQPQMPMLVAGLTENPLPILPPEAWAWTAALGELLGGAFVFVGLLTRLATLPIIVTMLVAIARVHGKNGFGMQFGGFEYNLVLIAMAGAILLAGPGLISADAFLFRRGLWSRGPQPLSEPSKRNA